MVDSIWRAAGGVTSVHVRAPSVVRASSTGLNLVLDGFPESNSAHPVRAVLICSVCSQSALPAGLDDDAVGAELAGVDELAAGDVRGDVAVAVGTELLALAQPTASSATAAVQQSAARLRRIRIAISLSCLPIAETPQRSVRLRYS